jgi:hypothetical protein
VLYEDDFQGERSFDVGETRTTGVALSRYAAGGFLMGLDRPGVRWHETSELRGDQLESMNDTVVDVVSERVQGRDARWGPMCRVVGNAGFYLFVVGEEGYAGIFASVGRSEPFDVLAEVQRSPIVREAIENGPHRLRATCIGDPIATLAFDVNGTPVLRAYDDDPRPRGSAGLWVESPTVPAAVLFDDLLIAGTED